MNKHNQTRRPARHEDPTNTAGLPHEKEFSRDELTRIYEASAKVLGLEPELRKAFHGPHAVMALARTALVTAGYYAEEAEASGVGPNAAWASARDLRAMVFSLGTTKVQSERQA